MPTTPRRVGRPPVTSRAQILAAARRLIDRDGWEELTIRRLATETGIGATTLYHHVRDKDDLLIQLIHDYAEQIPLPAPHPDPAIRITNAATAIHDTLAAWPFAAQAITTDGFITRLGDNALTLIETIITAATETGQTPQQAVHTFRTIWYYTVGEILVRVRAHHTHHNNPAPTPKAFPNLDPAQHPYLTSLAPQWPTLAWQNTYHQTLPALVNTLLTHPTPQESNGEVPHEGDPVPKSTTEAEAG
ncbi:TetR/AcrR family transcriptional regulator [Kitasatospora sp. RG8]|uniref:TetR/AcrR family transcriptional regulator n=1 Tax=Kitasatospora sp. RG8 TaxID=2820815 RepID=UPI001ADF2B12|nr:TetR/AcrR family transcriptional regulator [Kitasatospora sp. RG8]MBP0455868.1 TetR/AcrR family transcriptional regulator [Kitasatospora sp. RG8]